MGAAPLPVDDAAVTMTMMIGGRPTTHEDGSSSCPLSTTTTTTVGAGARGEKSCWPPGFRFHPTDEELVLYYLKRKICRRRFRLPMIADLDVYKLDPWELPDRSLLRTGDKQWYFFSPRDKKYPNGSRSNRATRHGYWKATGKDRTITHNTRDVGNKKTLVYYHGRAPKGSRTDWVMHEYTLDEQELRIYNNVQESYALYKVFRKSGPGPKNGEDYGAPFREEEWDDDDNDGEGRVDRQGDQNGTQEHSLMAASELARTNVGPNTLPFSELEDFLIGSSNDKDMLQQPTEASVPVSEVDFNQDVRRSLLFSSQVNSGEQQEDWYELGHIDETFLIEELCAAELAPADISGTMSNRIDHGQLMDGEDFLQIEDLTDPETEVQSSGNAYNMGRVHDGSNALNDFDDYFDASMFLDEAMGPLDGSVPDSYCGDLAEDETQNHFWHATAELWTQDLALNESSGAVLKQLMNSSSSGVAIASSTQGQQPQEQLVLEDDRSDSWFSSALSALLDSVPSRPALASENALITRALVRMSSFGAGQVGDTNNSGGTAMRRRGSTSNGRGYLFVSFLVGLGAIMWVLTIGTAVKLFRGLWSRFVS